MYVHRRCKPSKAELDLDKTVHGYCEICKNQGTIYLVKGTEDSYRHKRQGVTYVVRAELDKMDVSISIPMEMKAAVGTLTDEEVARVKIWTDTGDSLALDEIAPTEALEPVLEAGKVAEVTEETPLEEELTEETEAVEEAVEGAVEAEIEASIPEEREPEETPAEAELEYTFENQDLRDRVDLDDEIEPVETEPEKIREVEVLLANKDEEDFQAEEARKAKIARLEAELEKLRKRVL